ncbi:sigma-70 family RNA polymerase sigma factor [Rhizobiales bacterium TNE-4]|nr:sigma-70 family RNA polymerase sigma factor [Rhizobiales bacterium TNE-4]MBV1826381.1 sigma-70 family RNA polymerase sigma factor [Rhizobiales bacterium TNE-4]
MDDFKSSDERLSAWMRAASRGDQEAYRNFLSALLPVLRQTALRSLSRAGASVADSEDVVQEIMLAIHLRRHTWDESTTIMPWVYGIARHKMIDVLRRRGRRFEVPLDGFEEIVEAPAAAEALSERDIIRFLGRLGNGQRKVVLAVSVEGLSIRDAAKRLGITEGAARVTLHRGLKTLARIYGSER